MIVSCVRERAVRKAGRNGGRVANFAVHVRTTVKARSTDSKPRETFDY